MELKTAELKRLNALLSEKIDELKQTTAALQASEERYTLAVQGSRDGLWDRNIITNESYYSPRFKAILGYEEDEIAPQFGEFELRLHPDDHDRTLTALHQHLEQRVPYNIEYRLRTKQGDYRWIHARGQAIWDETGRATRMAGSISDITERKQMEETLRTSLKELADVKSALDCSSIVAITDAQGRITEVNDRFCEIAQYSRSELVGQNHRLINSGYHPPEFFQTMWKTIASGQVWQGEIKNRTKYGHYYWVDTTIVPILNKAGRPCQFVAIQNDITDRKQAEESLRHLNEDLEAKIQARTKELEQRAQALERSNADLQQFAYVASHDLQEPLRTISSFTELLAQDYGDRLDGEAEEYMAFIVDGATRMQQLIKDLLAYSRVDSRGKVFAPVDCNVVVKRVISQLKFAIEESRAVVTYDLLPEVFADESQVQQLFQNLISNALKFGSEAPPQVHISVTPQIRKDVPSEDVPSEDVSDRISEWTFCVSDNGIGIEPVYREQIFEIFQRLHSRRVYEGTGIGLAICRKIVQRHGGRIWVEDSPEKGSDQELDQGLYKDSNKGAAFYFTLPKKEV